MPLSSAVVIENRHATFFWSGVVDAPLKPGRRRWCPTGMLDIESALLRNQPRPDVKDRELARPIHFFTPDQYVARRHMTYAPSKLGSLNKRIKSTVANLGQHSPGLGSFSYGTQRQELDSLIAHPR